MEIKDRITFFLIISMSGLMLIFTLSCTAKKNKAGAKQLKRSPQFRDGEYHNYIDGVYDAGAAWRYAIKELVFGKRTDPVPDKVPPVKYFKGRDFLQKNKKALRFARLGHSTILIQLGDTIWLTDPVFSERASVFQWVGPKRFHPVPVDIEDMPQVESVLISHNHYDHLDYNSIITLKDKVNYFFIPLGIKDKLVSWGVSPEKIREMDWWDKRQVDGVEIVSTPAQHFSGRSPFDSKETLWTSWVIRNKNHAVFFSGDTGYFKELKDIGKTYGPFDVTFLECGAYNENWKSMHMMPEDNLKAYMDLRSRLLVPIHNGTFDLAFHSWYDPMEKIMSLAQGTQIRVLVPVFGQIIDNGNIPETQNWWKSLQAATQ